MNSPSKNTLFNYQNWFRILIVILLILGVFFRFVNLDQKAYWGDESATSLRISGYRFADLEKLSLNRNEMTIEDIQKYQYPNSEKGLTDLFSGSIAEEPQLPPFYFMMARFWVEWFGNSIAVTRSFSAVVSLLAFPCIYWLCRELFEVPLIGWMAMGVIAISPFHLLYAQEARPYSLWTVTILLSSAALLRAIRRQKILDWIIYSFSAALGIYTAILSLLVILGHGIYTIANESWRFSKTVIAYCLASLGGILLFIPWFLAVKNNLAAASGKTQWTSTRVPLISLVKTWLLNLSRIFFDLNDGFTYRNLWLYIAAIVLSVYGIYFLCRHSQKRSWLFIVTLIGVTGLALTVPDLIVGGRRSSVIRYLIPCYLGIEIAIAYLIATKIIFIPVKIWKQKLWQLTMVAIFSSGVLSCTVSSQTAIWWCKYREMYDPQVAELINQVPHPLVISPWFNLITLTHFLDSDVRIQDIRRQVDLTYIENNFSDVFVYNSQNLFAYFQKKAPKYSLDKIYNWKKQIEPVHTTDTTLWKLVKLSKN